VRVLLVDSSKVFRMGMRALLAEARDIEVVAEAGDAGKAQGLAAAQRPDLIVTDLDLPDRSAILLAGTLRSLAPATRILVLSAKVPNALVRQALLAGATGCVFKDQTPAEILTAIREAANGRQVLPARTHEAGAQDAFVDVDVPRESHPAALERLSAREREIFDLIIWGQTNKQIAQRLGISVKTVETHRSHINGKLQVHCGAELVRLASLCGVLVPGTASALASVPLRLIAKTA
jgi:RNA polymerase sigma factor (sigma-70 family)